MTWFDSRWKHRAPIAVDNTSGASTIDISCSVPAEWGFWSTVKSDGTDIRLVDADGSTVLTYKVDDWNYANKIATLKIDNYDAPDAAAVVLIWVYWGNSAASSAAGSFTVSSAKTGKIEPICQARPVIREGHLQPGRTKPMDQIAKAPDETLHVYFDVEGLLNRRCEKINGASRGEEMDYVKLRVLSGSSDQSSMYDEGKTRFIHPGIIKCHITAGANSTDYIISLRIGTTEGRVLNPRVLLRVKDVSE